MGRGLGIRQREILAALRALDQRRPGWWWSPVEVIGTLDGARSVEPLRVDPHEHTDRPRLEHLRQLASQGYPEYWATVREIEERIARREAGRAAREIAARRKAASRYPNQRRPEPRGGEGGNPSRVFALLARRGLVERVVFRGPGSVVRVAVEQETGR